MAGIIEPTKASLSASDEGYTLSADFSIQLGTQMEDAIERGVTLNFNLEFTLSRHRWYWVDEHVASLLHSYRLSYNALTKQYRLSTGALHRSFATLEEALRVLGRVTHLPIGDKVTLTPGETYAAALRLALDKSQLPKPFQVDAIASKDWQVEARTMRWQFVPPVESK